MKPLIWAMIATTLTLCAYAQSPAPAPSLTIVKPNPPQYPPIAMAARVVGRVELKVTIGQDGRTQKIDAVSGPEMLKKAAIESAKGSMFQWQDASQPDQF